MSCPTNSRSSNTVATLPGRELASRQEILVNSRRIITTARRGGGTRLVHVVGLLDESSSDVLLVPRGERVA